ncbi:MAG: GNAT family N-acetyltransferase [Desulfatibacillaceae bacterium]
MAEGYWPDEYVAKRTTAKKAIERISSGRRVFIGSACGEPQHLVRELAAQSGRFTDLEIVRLLSLESAPLTLIAEEGGSYNFNIRSFYLGSGVRKGLAESHRFHTPINLSALPKLFSAHRIPIHAALIQCSPPDDFGWMSLGISVDVTMAAARAADVVIAQVNPNMPRVLGRSFIHVNDVDMVVEHEQDLLSAPAPTEFDAAHQIARHVARLVDDGSTIQISLGATPQAILMALADKKDIGVHSQFLTDGIMKLVARGVITNRKKGYNEGKLVASSAIGSRNFYDFLHDNPSIEFHPSDYVNDPSIIARHNKMVSVQLAMTVDLTGQVAADALQHNNYCGVSGMLDFLRGAAQSPGGKAVLMVPSTSMDGQRSRIVPTLDGVPVVVPRGDVHYVVTEYGVVNLFGKTIGERAMAMISIANPRFRDELFNRAKGMGLIGPERSVTDSIHGVYPLSVEETREISGVEILFRPVKPTDERLIQEHFYNLDKNDVAQRFLHGKKSFVRDEVEDMVLIDYTRDFTMVAVVGDLGFEEIVGIGNYLHDPARNMAEVAFSISQSWQGRGIGKILMEKLVEQARENGIQGLYAYTSPGNKAMVKLFKTLPYEVVTRFDGDLFIMESHFSQPAPKSGVEERS